MQGRARRGSQSRAAAAPTHPLANGASALIRGEDTLAGGGDELGGGNQLRRVLQARRTGRLGARSGRVLAAGTRRVVLEAAGGGHPARDRRACMQDPCHDPMQRCPGAGPAARGRANGRAGFSSMVGLTRPLCRWLWHAWLPGDVPVAIRAAAALSVAAGSSIHGAEVPAPTAPTTARCRTLLLNALPRTFAILSV